MSNAIEDKSGLILKSEGENIVVSVNIMGFYMPMSTLTPEDIEKTIAFMQNHLATALTGQQLTKKP